MNKATDSGVFLAAWAAGVVVFVGLDWERLYLTKGLECQVNGCHCYR